MAHELESSSERGAEASAAADPPGPRPAPLARALECPAGSVLLDGISPPRGLGLLVGGVASATSVDGRTAAAEIMRAPDVFGESCVLVPQQKSPYVVVAQSDCRVLWLPL